MQVRDAGIWKSGKPYVRDAGVWKPAQKGWVRDAGVWKPFYTAVEPFSLSGSWETGWEDWAASGNATRTNFSLNARTGTWFAGLSGTGSGTLVYTIPKDEAAGLLITASVWRRNSSGAYPATARITIEETGGATDTGGGSSTITSWNEISATIGATGVGDVTVTILLSYSVTSAPRIDDWSIEGVVP